MTAHRTAARVRSIPAIWPAALLLAACSHQPREPAAKAPTPAAAVGDSNITITKHDEDAAGMKADDGGAIAWDGDPAGPAMPMPGVTLVVIGKDDNVVFEPPDPSGHAHVMRVRFHRTAAWTHALPPRVGSDAELFHDGDTIYLAHYSAISDGATIHALELATGAERWSSDVTGLGPVAHSQYANHIVLRMVRGALVVFGNESGGRYIEAFDPATGKMLSTRRVAP